MPRKPKQEKHVRVFRVSGSDVRVSFFPPTSRERSWYAYWKGLTTKKSTKATSLNGAVEAVERMLRGDTPVLPENVMSDEEFNEIQRRHYKRIKAEKETIDSCLEAIRAFRDITKVAPISLATADDCARFQDEALKLPRNWRVRYRDEIRRQKRISDESVERIKPGTVIKWSTALRAAFNRANSNAGSACVRNVVPPNKLLTRNPWDEFDWVKDRDDVEIRQFSFDELNSIIDFFEQVFPGVTAAKLAAQTFFWSYARREEISELSWTSLRVIDGEVHFDIVGKWRVRKWFRIPTRLFEELQAIRPESPFVFAAYTDQLRKHYESNLRPWVARQVRAEFAPENFGDWFYHRIVDWSKTQGGSAACVHVFRKTGLQQAVDGEAESRRVAEDARVSVRVMTTHYTTEQDRQFREKSNRTFERLARTLSESVLQRYGYTLAASDPLQRELEEAVRSKNWSEVQRLSELLKHRQPGDSEPR